MGYVEPTRESSEFLQCIKQEWEGEQAGREGVREGAMKGWSTGVELEKWAVILECCAVGRGPLSHTVWVPASHLYWHLVCISLRYPAINPPRAHSRPARQQSWQTQYPMTALSNASYGTVECMCLSVVFFCCVCESKPLLIGQFLFKIILVVSNFFSLHQNACIFGNLGLSHDQQPVSCDSITKLECSTHLHYCPLQSQGMRMHYCLLCIQTWTNLLVPF